MFDHPSEKLFVRFQISSFKIVRSCGILGIPIKDNFKLKVRVLQVCAKAYWIINMLYRCFITENIDALVRENTSYCRPILGYDAENDLQLTRPGYSASSCLAFCRQNVCAY